MTYIFRIRDKNNTIIFEAKIESNDRTFQDCKKEALEKAWENGHYKEDENHIMSYFFKQ